MRIVQLLPTITKYDAVSNEAMRIYRELGELDISNIVVGENIDPSLSIPVHDIIDFKPKTEDVLVYHASIASNRLVRVIQQHAGKKIMVYHNVTPSEYFLGWSPTLEELTRQGRTQISEIVNEFDVVIADSGFNADDVRNSGANNVHVVPLRSGLLDYQFPSEDEKGETGARLLFVGRIAPNKKQEDVLRVFYYYQKHLNPSAKLEFVGSYGGLERYYEYLKLLSVELGLNNVAFRGKISDRELVKKYQRSTIFLSLSEHEGFGVPIQEAMHFGLPVVAYNACAVPETLGNSGLLVNSKDYERIAALIHILHSDRQLRASIVLQQRQVVDTEYTKEKTSVARVLRKILFDGAGR